MKLSDLRATDLHAMPPVMTAAEAVECSRFAISFERNPRFKKVYVKGQSFTVGNWGGVNGPFYVVEDATTIIYRGTLHRITQAIKASVNPDFDV